MDAYHDETTDSYHNGTPATLFNISIISSSYVFLFSNIEFVFHCGRRKKFVELVVALGAKSDQY